MTQHDFIFSNRFRHRAARHAAFWLVCWFFFILLYHIPFGVFPGWNTEKFSGNVARIGLVRWLWLRLANSILMLIPILAFAYSIIYFVLPRYFFNKKDRFTSTILLIGILIIILSAHYFSGLLISYNYVSADPTKRVMPGSSDIIKTNIKIILYNYPLVAGFAVILKMMKRGRLKQIETEQIFREKANAEMQLLKAQIHPHFLFNTLNNIYFFTLTASQKAPEILRKLSDILRYILNECSQPLVPLAKELKMIEDYITLEKIRYGEHLKMDVEISGDCHNKMIPPLLLIPLVENSFKHGASKMLAQPRISLNVTITEEFLFFVLSNSRPVENNISQPFGHIGLNNVKKRLQLLYPGAHELNIAESPAGFEVFMKIRLEVSGIENEVKTELIYAMA